MKSVFRVDPRTLLKRREEPCLDVVLIVNSLLFYCYSKAT